MATAAQIPTRDQYTIGWICAIPDESADAKAMLEEVYVDTQVEDSSDDNLDTFGRIARNYVVIASLPAGNCGLCPATAVFQPVQVGLMVGIGGGFPTAHDDIRIRDVVVSQPQNSFGGVVQYDRGRFTSNENWKEQGSWIRLLRDY